MITPSTIARESRKSTKKDVMVKRNAPAVTSHNVALMNAKRIMVTQFHDMYNRANRRQEKALDVSVDSNESSDYDESDSEADD